jgi:hypothetical protein
MFIRVQHADAGGLRHEFDISTVMFERHPDRYVVVDDKPVQHARPATYPEPGDPSPVGGGDEPPKKAVKRSK